MITRASGPLAAAYMMMLVAGVFFLATPSTLLAEATGYNDLTIIWGLFYLVGGAVSFSAILLRYLATVFKNRISLWYFEIAGISLLTTANLVYAYACVRAGLYYDESNIIALGLVLTAFSAGLIARLVETLRLVRILSRVAVMPSGSIV